MPRTPGFETGGNIVERDLFGAVEGEARKHEFEYMKFREAMELVRRFQPGDPKDPKTEFAYEVLAYAESLLTDVPRESLNFFTAIRSGFDRFHGVDGWFELDSGERVTIDLTQNPEKENAKADVVFHVPFGGFGARTGEGPNQELIQYAHSLGEVIAERLAEARRNLTKKN